MRLRSSKLELKHIILTGFMGTGKSSVGKVLAARLQLPFIDTDEIVEALSQKSIAKIFAEEGEAEFRRRESRAIAQALKKPQAVIAVGGGAPCFRNNLEKIGKGGVPILLTARISTILQRLSADRSRPLLQEADKEEKIRALLAQRAPHYHRISWQLPTDGRTPEQIAEEILRLLPLEQSALRLNLGERSYPLYFQREGLGALPGLIRRHCPSERLIVVTNQVVARLYGKTLRRHLQAAFDLRLLILPDGEQTKNLKSAAKIYEKLVAWKADRKTPLLAFGGGVIGDLAGFAAATYLRGIPFVQIPTTLLAQVDSSIGGKTGVDLPAGKNLVGAFYQPRFVLIDESFLKTLSRRQLTCGMAEVIKYAAIFDAKLFRRLEDSMEGLLERPEAGIEPIIRRCCELKAWVVERDEKETLGLRAKLNFGHTVGHAVEALTRYKKFTHGEAIAMGMVFAARFSEGKTGFSSRELDRLQSLIARAGLPTELPKFPIFQYRRALIQDKKRVSSQIHFVYLNKIGKSAVLPTSLNQVLEFLYAARS
ncbi:MAG TPA: 3-dehydroquinate synthase [Deltaproteobacteria bacterium]|nr:3-dehydroquinate synthase [Deltaproteobacteria bacterium]